MAGIPEDIKKGLANLAESSKTPKETIVAQLKEIVENDPTVQAMEQIEFKIRYAYAVLLNRYTSTGGAVQMYLRPLSKPRARRVKSQGTMKYVGNIYALVKLVETGDDGKPKVGDLQHGAGTLWEKAAESAMLLSPDKVYKTTLRATKAPGGLELGGNDAMFVEASDVQFPSNDEFFGTNIKPKLNDLLVNLADLEISNRENQVDLSVIKAMVLDNGTGETAATNTEFGRYTVTDDSLIGKTDEGPSNYSMWVHPDEVIWDNGSHLYFVGTVNVDKSKDPAIARFDCHFVMPTEIALKRSVEAKPVAKESINIDDLPEEEPAAAAPAEPAPEATPEPAKAESTDDDIFAI